MSSPRRPAGSSRSSTPGKGDRRIRHDALLEEALAALSRAAAERVGAHPLGHLAGRGGRLELTLEVPLTPAGEVPAEAVEQARESLDGELETLLLHRAAFAPGRVFCLRCAAADCEHSAPQSSRQVFAGYGPTGVPAFADFGQWLLERQHEQVDELYRRPPRLVAVVVSGAELARQLLPAFRDRRLDYRIHGQVAAGWFPVAGRDGVPDLLALTFQVISSAHRGQGRRGLTRPGRTRPGRRRLGLNVLGVGPAGEPLAELYDRLGSVPWRGAVRWSQSALESIERFQGAESATPERLSDRIEGMLGGVARRLAQHRRARDRRTGHAQQRHREGDRPTRMAVRDLDRAGEEGVLYDSRRETLIVLGEKGRAHVFNAAGKLVTSIRYSPESIARKKKLGRWRPAAPEEIAALRGKVL